MVAFASSRASLLLSLAVLGLACTGIREDPSPGGAPPPGNIVVTGSGGAGGGLGGGTSFGGGSDGGSTGTGVVFDDCSCASIIESNTVAVCNSCVDGLLMPSGSACDVQLQACLGDSECSLARTLLANNDCGGDPTCTSTLLTAILSDDSAALLFGYYSCVCTPCALCTLGGGVGGGAPVGGGTAVAGSCDVSLK